MHRGRRGGRTILAAVALGATAAASLTWAADAVTTDEAKVASPSTTTTTRATPERRPIFLVCPAEAEAVKAAQEGTAAALDVPLRYTGAGKIEMVLIPPGEFLMGSPEAEKDRRNDEGPQHRVRIDKAFYMSLSEITQAQFRSVMGYNPSRFRGMNRPVERVSWHEAVEFCERLSKKDRKRYRLPTEAEWEYCCRAGTETRYWWGEEESEAGKHANVLDEKAPADGGQDHPGFGVQDAHPETSPTKVYDTNRFGLYDMIGNVWDWCQSLKRPYPYRRDDGREGLAGEGDRVLRGGSWRSYKEFCRCAARYGLDPASKDTHVGFRVVMDLPTRP